MQSTRKLTQWGTAITIAGMTALSLSALHDRALHAIADASAGNPLDALSRSLISLGVHASVTVLNPAAVDAATTGAFDAGASVAQIQEVLALVSGLGVHSLMATAPMLLLKAQDRGLLPRDVPRDATRQMLWQRYVGDDPYWAAFERDVPGFLDALLTLSPDVFAGFFEYCALPWKCSVVKARTKELVAMATDATPSHRFWPGFRLHLRNALALGAGQAEIRETLEIAAHAADHAGVG